MPKPKHTIIYRNRKNLHMRYNSSTSPLVITSLRAGVAQTPFHSICHQQATSQLACADVTNLSVTRAATVPASRGSCLLWQILLFCPFAWTETGISAMPSGRCHIIAKNGLLKVQGVILYLPDALSLSVSPAERWQECAHSAVRWNATPQLY